MWSCKAPAMSLASSSYEILEELWANIAEEVGARSTLQSAAQLLLDALYEQFSEDLVLARVFVTSELRDLPPRDQVFVRACTQTAGVLEALDESTNVLSLLATRGRVAAWNERERSDSHLGIPLLSERFVQEIPMITRLLAETGFDARWYGSASPRFVSPAR